MNARTSLAKSGLAFLVLMALAGCLEENAQQQTSTRFADLVGLQIASMPIAGKICQLMPSSSTTMAAYSTRIDQVSACSVQGTGSVFTDRAYSTPRVEAFGPGMSGSLPDAETDRNDNYLSLCSTERQKYLSVVAPKGQFACWNGPYKDVVDLLVSTTNPNSSTRDCANLYDLGASYRHVNDWACLDGKASTFARAYDPIDFSFGLNGCAGGLQKLPADISGLSGAERAATQAEKEAIWYSQKSNTCSVHNAPNSYEVNIYVPAHLGLIGFGYYDSNPGIMRPSIWENGAFSNKKVATFRLRSFSDQATNQKNCTDGYLQFIVNIVHSMKVKDINPTQNSGFCYQGPSGFAFELASSNLGNTQPDKSCLELQAGKHYLCHPRYAVHANDVHVITRVELSKSALNNQSICSRIEGNGIPANLVQDVCITETLLDYGIDYHNWAAGQPNNGGTPDTAGNMEECAAANSSGLWSDARCSESKRFACRHRDDENRWLITAATGPWTAGEDECRNAGSRLGEYIFSKPKSEYENFQLGKLLGSGDVWINYAQKSDLQWVSPDYQFTFKHFVNVARDRDLVIQSSTSTEANRDAYRAVDGNRDGLAANGSVAQTQVETGPWWQVDLEDEQEVAYVSVWNREDGCCAASLKNAVVTLYDAEGTLLDTKTIVNPERENVLRFSGHRNVRFVRVAGAPNTNLALSLAEVEVWVESEISHCSDDLIPECTFPQLLDVLDDLNKLLGSYVDLTPTIEQLRETAADIDVLDIESATLDPANFEMKLKLNVDGYDVNAFIYQVRDQYDLPHIMLSFALPSDKLSWQNLFGDLADAPELQNMRFPNALITIPLSGDNGDLYPPISLYRSSLPAQVAALYDSVYGPQYFEQRIYAGVNIAGSIPANQILSESIRSNLGIHWDDTTQVVLSGSLGISLADLRAGNWLAHEEFFLQSQFPIPNSHSFTALNDASVKNLFGSIYVADGEMELGLATRIETVLNHQQLEIEASTRQALGRNQDFVLKGELSAWKNGLGLETGVLKRIGMMYWSNSVNQQFTLSGKLAVNSLALENVVTLNRDRVQGEKNLELRLRANHITDDDLEALLKDLTESEYRNVLPDRIEEIKDLDISFGVGKSSWLEAKGKSTICLQKYNDADNSSGCKTPVDIAFRLTNGAEGLAFNAELDLQAGQQFVLDPIQGINVLNASLASDYVNGEFRLKVIGHAQVTQIANMPPTGFKVELLLENNESAHNELTIQTESQSIYTLAQLQSAVVALGYHMPSTDWITTLKNADPAAIRLTNLTFAVRKGTATNLHVAAVTRIGTKELGMHMEATATNGYIGFNFLDNQSLLSDVLDLASLPETEKADERQVDFDQLTFVYASGPLAYRDLTYVGRQYLDQHFAFNAGNTEFAAGLNFLAMVGTGSSFANHLAVFGHKKPIYINGLLRTSPSLQLDLTAGMGKILNCNLDTNKADPACANAANACSSGAGALCNMPYWLSATDLNLNLALSSTRFDVGFSGQMDVRPAERSGITTLVVNGDLNIHTTDLAVNFCAELRDDSLRGSDISKIQIRSSDTPAQKQAKIGQCLEGDNGMGTGYPLFGIEGVTFNNVGLYLGLHPLTGTLDFEVGANINFVDGVIADNDPQFINIESFKGSFNALVPTGIKLSVSSNRTFSTNDVFNIYNAIATSNRIENTERLPRLELFPVRFSDTDTEERVRFGIEADIQSFTSFDFMAGVRLTTEPTGPLDIGKLAARMTTSSFLLEGEVNFPGMRQRTTIQVNQESLKFAADATVSVSGQIYNYARCAGIGFNANFACGIATVHSRACGVVSAGACNAQYYLNGQQECENQLICVADGDCTALYQRAHAECANLQAVPLPGQLTAHLVLNVDWAGGFSGRGIASFSSPAAGCYEIGGRVSYNGQFSLQALNNFSNGECGNTFGAGMLMASAAAVSDLPYPLYLTDAYVQTSMFDFNGDGVGDILYTMEVPVIGEENSENDWLISYGGMSEPELLQSEEEFVSQLVFGDVDGNGSSEIVVERQDEAGYQWLATSGERKWVNVLPASVRFVSAGAAGAQIEVSHGGTKTVTTLLDLNFGNFRGGPSYEALLTTQGSDAVTRFFMCELPSTACEQVVITGFVAQPDSLYIGQFDGDAYHEIFVSHDDDWYLVQPQQSGGWVTTLYRANTMNDLKDADSVGGQGYDINQFTSNISKSLRFGDFDGDGLTDVFTSRTKNDLGQWIWTVSYRGGDWEYLNAAWEHPSMLRVSDFDGDAVADVFTASETTRDGLVDWSVCYRGKSTWVPLNANKNLPLSVLSLGETKFD